ncbi:hypothetical protein GOBAR_DD06215 [Gossypium barbadense]|nr:hypothetical protein GOBAR_DD06215 [Gossypium barbadense]
MGNGEFHVKPKKELMGKLQGVLNAMIELKKDRFKYHERQSSRLSKRASKEFEGKDSSSEEEANERRSCRKRGKTMTSMRKGKPKPLSCFLCDGPHHVRECPRQASLSVVVKSYEESKAKGEHYVKL